MAGKDGPSSSIDSVTEDFDLMGSYAAAPGGTFTVGNLYRTGTSARFSAENDKLVFDFILPEIAGAISHISFYGQITPTLTFKAWDETKTLFASSVKLIARYENGHEVLLDTGVTHPESLTFDGTTSYPVGQLMQSSVVEQVFIRVEIPADDSVYFSNPGSSGGIFTCSFNFGASDLSYYANPWPTSYNFLYNIQNLVNSITNVLLPQFSGKLDLILDAIKDQDNNVKASVDKVKESVDKVDGSVNKVNDTLTSTPDENATASGFKDDMKEQSESIGSMVQEIEQKQNRPTAAEVVPVVNTGVINPTDTAAADGKELVADMLSTPLLLQMLTIVFSLAFLRYVIFGKSEG